MQAEGVNLGPLRDGGGPSGDGYLLPDDLVHLTRRSLFLVIDSDNSTSFARLQVRGPRGAGAARPRARSSAPRRPRQPPSPTPAPGAPPTLARAGLRDRAAGVLPDVADAAAV